MCNTSENPTTIEKKKLQGPTKSYAGSAACRQCHQTIFDSYATSPHYNTSSWAHTTTHDSLQKEGEVRYNENLFVKVHSQQGRMYQTAYSGNRWAASHAIDLVIGSGKKGRTFLTWGDSSLYQLPLSYSNVLGKWVNSPGYPADKVSFNRIISVKCFECHATYADQLENQYNQPYYDSTRMVLSISCETCHGPGAGHIAFHLKNGKSDQNDAIINTAKLSRQQQLDACASCHSGIRQDIRPAFSFRPGDKVDEYFRPSFDSAHAARLDVHGNQYGLLTASKCFKNSVTMTCSTCHNAHQRESGQRAVFAARCMTCHNGSSHGFCSLKNTSRDALLNNCIDCHMPMQQTGQIIFNTNQQGKKAAFHESVRTHLIAIYPSLKKR